MFPGDGVNGDTGDVISDEGGASSEPTSSNLPVMVSDTFRCFVRESISTGDVISSGLCGSAGTARLRLLPPGGVVVPDTGPPSSVNGPETAAGPK